MRSTERVSNLLKRASEIYVVERPDGIYLARLKGSEGWEAEGATAGEAEAKLLDLLEARRESHEIHKSDVFADPDKFESDED